jgi:hypothetical protein
MVPLFWSASNTILYSERLKVTWTTVRILYWNFSLLFLMCQYSMLSKMYKCIITPMLVWSKWLFRARCIFEIQIVMCPLNCLPHDWETLHHIWLDFYFFCFLPLTWVYLGPYWDDHEVAAPWKLDLTVQWTLQAVLRRTSFGICSAVSVYLISSFSNAVKKPLFCLRWSSTGAL